MIKEILILTKQAIVQVANLAILAKSLKVNGTLEELLV